MIILIRCHQTDISTGAMSLFAVTSYYLSCLVSLLAGLEMVLSHNDFHDAVICLMLSDNRAVWCLSLQRMGRGWLQWVWMTIIPSSFGNGGKERSSPPSGE